MGATVFIDPYHKIYPERSADLFDPDTDWHEITPLQSGGDIHLSTDGTSHAQLTGWVYENKLRSFAAFTLGYAAALGSADAYVMRRWNPPTHPQLPFLRVRSFTWHPECPKAGTVTSPPPPAPFPTPGDPDVDHKNRVRSMNPRSAGDDYGGGAASGNDRLYTPFCKWYGRFEKALVTVDFAHPRWPIVEDNDPNFDPADESGRNVFWTVDPALDVLELSGAAKTQLYWRETNASGPTVATNIPQNSTAAVLPQGSAFPAPLAFLEPKVMYTANWMQVPRPFVMNANLVPDKILTVLGKTNNAEWYGAPRGTLLFMGVTFENFVWPVYSTDTYNLSLWNVKFHFKQYDPRKYDDPAITYPVPPPAVGSKRGWRTFKWQNGFSYWATRHQGDELYQEADYDRLFEHREKP